MITISVEVCGDDWVNKETVKQLLYNSNHKDPIVLDLHAEGPSLHAVGVVGTLLEYLQQFDRRPGSVYVNNWSNAIEQIPFNRLNRHELSHFFWMSDRYANHVPDHRTLQFLFGYFVGRRTVPRCTILMDIQQHYSKHFLLSLMNTVTEFKNSDLDPVSEWTDPTQFAQWLSTPAVSSLDNHTIRDQFSQAHNTNASLLKWYSTFDIELVAETYTHGDTFFVTEKTVRPIVAGKSMLVYGPKNYLARLQELGFQTWGDVWDESYDQLIGPQRWQAMRSVIDKLLSQDQEQLHKQCLPIVMHNQQHAQALIKKYKPQ